MSAKLGKTFESAPFVKMNMSEIFTNGNDLSRKNWEMSSVVKRFFQKWACLMCGDVGQRLYVWIFYYLCR